MTSPREFDPDAPASPDAGAYGLPFTPEESQLVLIPVPWEATTSYRTGTVDGPAAIRQASMQVDLFDQETGEPWRAGIHMLDEDQRIRGMSFEARGDVETVLRLLHDENSPMVDAARAKVDQLGELMNDWVATETNRWLDKGKLVGVVGGDHSVPFGSIQAIARRNPGMGILHLDAHADLRDAYEGFTWSHASIMHNVMTRIPEVGKLVQVGIRDLGRAERAMIDGSGGRIVTFFDAELQAARFAGETWDAQCKRIVAALPPLVHLSFDIDGLDPTLCPNTGTPVPGGLSFAQLCHLMRVVAEAGRKIVGFDLTEVAPGPGALDGTASEWDGNVGARLLYKMMGWALKTRESTG
jgi:agmatinase